MGGQFDRKSAAVVELPKLQDRLLLREPINFSKFLKNREGGVTINDFLVGLGVDCVLVGSEARVQLESGDVDESKLAALEEWHQIHSDFPKYKSGRDADMIAPLYIVDQPPLYDGGESLTRYVSEGYGADRLRLEPSDWVIQGGKVWMSTRMAQDCYQHGISPADYLLNYMKKRAIELEGDKMEYPRTRAHMLGTREKLLVVTEHKGLSDLKASKELVLEVRSCVVDAGQTLEERLQIDGFSPAETVGYVQSFEGNLWLTEMCLVNNWDGNDNFYPIDPPNGGRLEAVDVGKNASGLRYGLKLLLNECLRKTSKRGNPEKFIEILKHRVGKNRFEKLPIELIWGQESRVSKPLELLEKMVDCWVVDPKLATEVFDKSNIVRELFGDFDVQSTKAGILEVLNRQLELLQRYVGPPTGKGPNMPKQVEEMIKMIEKVEF